MMRGFTLLEALVAMGILAGLFTAIYGVQASAVRSVRYARDLQRAALLARDKVLEVEWKLKKDGFSVADMTMEGDFDDAQAPEFKWRAEIRRVKAEAFENMASPAVDGEASPLAGAFAPAFSMIGRRLADQVRELRVVVSWKDGTYDESFDVVTHIVQLTGMGSPAASPVPSAGPGGTSLLQQMKTKPATAGGSSGTGASK